MLPYEQLPFYTTDVLNENNVQSCCHSLQGVFYADLMVP